MLSWQIGIASAPKAAVAGNGGKVQLLQTADNIFFDFFVKVLAISFEAWYSDPRRKCLSFCLVYKQKTPASLFFLQRGKNFQCTGY